MIMQCDEVIFKYFYDVYIVVALLNAREEKAKMRVLQVIIY